MRISHRYHFVFLALPRTGSTTVRSVLNKYSDVRSVHISKITNDFPFYNHVSAAELKTIFEKKDWEWPIYKKFCVVRNPYDRVVSLYHHHIWMMTKNNKEFKKEVKFRDYVKKINPKDTLTTSLENFIFDQDGVSLVDDVLKYENLAKELLLYLKQFQINLDIDGIPHLNSSSDRVGYREYYDNYTRKRVGELYSYEIERFNYRF